MKKFKISNWRSSIVSAIINFISTNIIVVVYGVFATVLELLSLRYFDCAPYLRQPLFTILLLFILLLALVLIKSKIIKAITTFLLLVLQCIILLVFNYLFLANGTVFERSMLKQRNDAYATIEQLNLTKGLVIFCVCTLIIYVIFLFHALHHCHQKGNQKKEISNTSRISILGLELILITIMIVSSSGKNDSAIITDYQTLLYRCDNSYQKRGVTGNFIYEMLQGDQGNYVDLSDVNELDADLYSSRSDTSSFHGVSAGNNLVMILAESCEWYPLKTYSKELTAKIYPNLSKLLEDSVYCSNFYSREKTDTAETLMMLGSNPTGKYVHNDFAGNSYPYSIPNLFRQQAIKEGDSDVVIQSFHQNTGSFYNRKTAHLSFGFDRLYDIYDMEGYGLINTWKIFRERTLDSLTMNAMKDVMFLENQRFFSFWITFSTHGFYNTRENLGEYYERFDQLGVFPEGDKYQNYLRTYAAAVADLDKAIGLMYSDLSKKSLLDTTTIVLVADHNTYYNGLSNYAKKIDTQYDSELYRVPMIIYDKKLTNAMKRTNQSREIEKFTTTSDVIPTILDLFGIPGYDTLYLGSTILNKDKESIIYSRAYNIFINDKFIGYSLNNLKYDALEASSDDKAAFKARVLKHLRKLQIIDKVFYSNYFSNHEYYP